jgi:ATP-dependent exoDNAse (exonuclease V) alpha subunit
MIGDTKQLQSLSAGRMFHKLQELGFKTVEMTETLRQEDQGYKDVIKDVTERRIDDAFEKLLKQERIHEDKDPQALKDQIVHDYTDSTNYRSTIIVTALNRDRAELNQKIREGLKSKGKLNGNELTFTTRESKGLNPSERHFAQSYQSGDIITINKSGIGIKVGAEARVVNVNSGNHTITVQTSKGAREIDLNRHGEKLAVYQEKGTPVMKGDKIVFLKNDRDLNIQNGLTGTVKAVTEKGDMTVKLDTGREIRFNLHERYNYIDHGYAVTDYKSQGQTANAVLYHAETLQQAKSTFNSFYVAITRGKQDVKVYTDSVETLKEQVKHEQVKSSTLDFTKEQPDKQPELDKADKESTTEASTIKESMTKDSRVELPEEDRSRSRNDDDGGREIEMEL